MKKKFMLGVAINDRVDLLDFNTEEEREDVIASLKKLEQNGQIVSCVKGERKHD